MSRKIFWFIIVFLLILTNVISWSKSPVDNPCGPKGYDILDVIISGFPIPLHHHICKMSHSMCKEINWSDYIAFRVNHRFYTPEVGEIVIYNIPGDILGIIHRIIEIEGERVKTKGDCNLFADGWINKTQITHVVRERESI